MKQDHDLSIFEKNSLQKLIYSVYTVFEVMIVAMKDSTKKSYK